MSKCFNKIILLSALIASFSSAIAAPDAGRESVFSVGVGGRALGMGGAFTSLADDATAVYYNPAGLGLLEYQELTFMHMDLFEGTKYNFGSWVTPVNQKFGIGVGYMWIGADDLIKVRNFVPLGSFNYSQSQLLFSVGGSPSRYFTIGATAKAVTQEIDSESDWALGLDAGVIIIPHRYVRLGIASRDAVAPKLGLNTTEEKTPTSVAGGIGLVRYPLSKRTKFSASFELEKFEDRSEKIHTGGELLFDNTYAIRGGYDRDNVSLGVGYAYRMFSIDYAYKVMDYIDNSHRISLSVKLAEPKEASAQEIDEPVASLPPTAGAVQYEFTSQFQFYKEKADTYFYDSQLDSALMYYKRAHDFDPDNVEVKTRIEMISHVLYEKRTTPPPPLPEEKPQSISNGQTEKIVRLYLEQSRAFYNEGYYAPALELLEQILLMNPQHKEAKQLSIKIGHEIEAKTDNYLTQAQAAEKSGEIAKAVEAYTRVLELNPSHPVARQGRERLFQLLSIPEKLYLGIKQFEQNQFTQARSQFEAVLSIDSTNEIARYYLDKMQSPTTQPKETTLEQLQADAAIWPLYLEGLKYMRDKQYQKAVDAWEKVLKVYPNSSHTINNINQARLRLGAEKEK